MVFSSLFFIYIFLPLNLLFYFLSKDIRKKNMVMLIFSLIFYAWGEPVYVLLLVGTCLVNWFIALQIERCGQKSGQKAWMILACIISLGALGVFKYGGFMMKNFQVIFGVPEVIPKIALPIGISFYTFQILSYVIDVYRGDVEAQKSFAHVLMYTSLFHQCIAGPIIRYKDVSEEIIYRRETLTDMSGGISRFVTGLGKKVLLANVCGELADKILLTTSAAADAGALAANRAALASTPVALVWLGTIMYTLQIYLDFSAYSDMAIGLGRMIGFHYKENFDYPYTASSVTVFWRKWHISLGSFFRDYVYIPLGGNRHGKKRMIISMFVVWALTGLWHGASWNFVFWGLYYFAFLLLEKLWLGEKMKRLPQIVGHIYLLLVVNFGWVLFRFENMSLGWTVIKGMFGLNGNAFTSFEAGTIWKNYIVFILIAAVASTPLIKRISLALKRGALSGKVINRIYIFARIAAVVILMIISTAALVGDSYNPFIYFQF